MAIDREGERPRRAELFRGRLPSRDCRAWGLDAGVANSSGISGVTVLLPVPGKLREGVPLARLIALEMALMRFLPAL